MIVAASKEPDPLVFLFDFFQFASTDNLIHETDSDYCNILVAQIRTLQLRVCKRFADQRAR